MSLVFALAVVSFLDALFDYFAPDNGIHGTAGALLVVVSTLLLLIAAGIVAVRLGPRWLRIVLQVLIVLDFAGTGLAAYLLEAWILLTLVGIALLVWLARVVRPVRPSLPHTVQP